MVLTGDSHGAVEAGAAVIALEEFFTQVVLELVLPTATHRVLVCSARRNLHLEHFCRGKEMVRSLSSLFPHRS